MINSDDAEIRQLYAMIHFGLYNLAIDVLDTIIQRDPGEPRWVAEKLALLADTCQWDQFYPLQQKLFRDFPGTAEYYLAQALTPGIMASRRLSYLEKAVQLDPDFSKLYYYRGQVLRDLKMNHQARLDFDQCLNLDPANYDIYLLRAKVNQICGAYYEAFTDLLQYMRSPNCDQRGPIFDEMINVLQCMKELEAAFDKTINKPANIWVGKGIAPPQLTEVDGGGQKSKIPEQPVVKNKTESGILET